VVWRWDPHLSKGDGWQTEVLNIGNITSRPPQDVPSSNVECLVLLHHWYCGLECELGTVWSISGRVLFLILQRTCCEFGSLDSVVGIATSYELYGPAFDFRQGQELVSAPGPSIPPLWPIQPSIQWVPGEKLPEREGELSSRVLLGLRVIAAIPVLSLSSAVWRWLGQCYLFTFLGADF
jgi:hypothetical protein